MRHALLLPFFLLAIQACGPAAPVEDAGPVFGCASEEDCDGDGDPRSVDCDDYDERVSPSRVEIVGNQLDDDCDPKTTDAEVIAVAPTLATIFVPTPIEVSGAGEARVGAIELSQSVGTMEVDGEVLAAFVDERVPWPEFQYTLHQVIAVGADRLVTAWVYCDGAVLSWVYLGDVSSDPLDVEQATGFCGQQDEAVYVDLELPAFSLPIPPTVSGFEVDGPAISVTSGGVGSVRVDGLGLTLLPFRIVDCSADCGGAGWYELHSLLWSSAQQHVAFGILYLYLDENIGRGRDVVLVGARPLPDVSASFPENSFFEASFTTP